MSKPRARTKHSMRLSLPSIALVGILFFGNINLSLATAEASVDAALDATNSFLNNIHITSNVDPLLAQDSAISSFAVAAAQNQSLFWGPYRPNLYFGTRPRLPNTVMTGLMWYGTQDYSGIDNMRHGCEERDGFEKYGWLKADGRTFGVQQLKDTRNNVELTTDFIKIPGGDHGGSWGARISGKAIRDGQPMSIATMYYIGIDGDGDIDIDTSSFDAQSPIVLDGRAKDLGDFEFVVEQTKGTNKEEPIHYFGAVVPEGTIWRVKEFTREVIVQKAQMLQESGRTNITPKEFFSLPNQFFGTKPNALVFQMHYDAPFEFEVRFSSKSSPNSVSSSVMTKELTKAVNDFEKRFESTFHLKKHGYSNSMINFAKATMSNLVGGIGYFYGSAIVDESPTYEDGSNEHLEGPVARRPNPDPKPTEPASLFSAVPSRSFFPRGFYWDEGFHQTLIGQWDNDLSLEIIESWFNRQDSDGWIQREQILGDEARSRVPPEFHVQYPEHANPPTLFKAINLYLDRLQNVSKTFSMNAHGASDNEQKQQAHFGVDGVLKHDVTNARLMSSALAAEYLTKLYPKLKTNYYWMRRTMRGGIRDYGRQSRSRIEGYRWRGRTKTHTLTSGLDDYPRAPHPSLGELHVDLLSWIGFMNRNLQSIAAIVGEEDDVEELEDHYKAIVANVDDLHWDKKQKAYCDLTVDEDDMSIHVCHKGYVSLFPLLLGIIDPESEKLDHVLDLMYNPDELWSPFGLRSLSKSDEFFGTGENYWKGPIWINANYLALHSLKENYLTKGPYKEKAKKIYNELRENLINNIYSEYERTGYVWEQYNDMTGHGQRSHPFTGWTSMVVLMMQMGRAE